MGWFDWLFGSSSSDQQQQQPQAAPAATPAADPAPAQQKSGDDCPGCKSAEQDCVNNCVMKSAMSGSDPSLDMGQASKNAACLAMCEDKKDRCTC
jgi:hypothetical protein